MIQTNQRLRLGADTRTIWRVLSVGEGTPTPLEFWGLRLQQERVPQEVPAGTILVHAGYDKAGRYGSVKYRVTEHGLVQEE